MGKVYIIANFNFGSRASPDRIEQFNKEIINKWNSIITKDDYIYIFGTLGGETRCETREVLNKLNGKIYICNYSKNKNFSKEEWKNWNIYMIWNASFYFNDNSNYYFFPLEGYNINNFSKYKDNLENAYTMIWNNKTDEVYKNNVLSIDAKHWDYTPISLEDVPDIINRMKEFEKMEEN